MTKQEVTQKILESIELANKHGYTVVIAGDEEGNLWNEINPKFAQYGDTDKCFIALGVYKDIPDEVIFKPTL